jgi:hypothetical protein
LGPISIPAISALVIMVNPSTADAENDDPTIRKLIGYGERNGWSRLVVGNLFAYRSTDVRQLAQVEDPIGPANDWFLYRMMQETDELIFAWGSTGKLPPRLRERWREIDIFAREIGKQPMSLGEPCADGHPRHPVIGPYCEPRPWYGPETARLMQ